MKEHRFPYKDEYKFYRFFFTHLKQRVEYDGSVKNWVAIDPGEPLDPTLKKRLDQNT